MAKKKIYAVRAGRKQGIFTDWEECKASVTGYPGAEYKGFGNEEDARAYLAGNGSDSGNFPEISLEAQPVRELEEENEKDGRFHSQKALSGHQRPDILTAYVDGSFDLQLKKYSFGCIVLEPNGSITRESGSGEAPNLLKIRNVAGEMMGALRAVRWAIKYGYSAVEIHYDYAGIECWVTDAWEAKQDVTKNYEDYMKKMMKRIQISFRKVKAHSGNHYNEEVDHLAKEALTETFSIPFPLEDEAGMTEEAILLADRG